MADPTDDEIKRIRALLAEAGRCGCDAPSAHGLRTAHIATLLAALDAERAEVERLRHALQVAHDWMGRAPESDADEGEGWGHAHLRTAEETVLAALSRPDAP